MMLYAMGLNGGFDCGFKIAYAMGFDGGFYCGLLSWVSRITPCYIWWLIQNVFVILLPSGAFQRQAAAK